MSMDEMHDPQHFDTPKSIAVLPPPAVKTSSRQVSSSPFSATVESNSPQDTTIRAVQTSRHKGFLSRVCIVHEADDPRVYPDSIKWCITLIVALAAATAPTGSAIILRK